MNQVILMGRLTKDPELRQTPLGVAFMEFSIAVNRKTKDENGNYKTDFIYCTAWRNTAEHICRYFKKGSMIALTGEIRMENYTDKYGNPRTSFTVNVNNVYFTGEKPQAVDETVQKMPDTIFDDLVNEFTDIVNEEDDLPF